MKIPNRRNAEVTESKVLDYLLSLGHPEGESKAKFFLRWGFTLEAWTMLAAALVKQANDNDYTSAVKGRYGTKYIVVAPIVAPKGTTPPVKTIWIVSEDEEFPRLITAYPAS
jgi:hypothetical protein